MASLDGIKRGRLSPAEIAAIEQLAVELEEPTPSAIARRLNRHPATVQWQMIVLGVIERPIVYNRTSYRRADGTEVAPYAPEHDRRLVELRTAGDTFKRIAAALTAEFGITRSAHGVRVRNAMLAAYDAPEGDDDGR